MKYSGLVWKNLRRNRRRTILTAISVAVALFLFVALQSVLTALAAAGNVGSESRLVTRSATGITFPLPQSYFQRLGGTEGVKGVSWGDWFGGIYIDQRNFFAQFAIDAERYLAMYPEIQVPEDQKKAFLAERASAIVGRGLMNRFGWNLGQTVVLKGTVYPGDWEITIRAVYTPGTKSFPDNVMYLRYDYVYERSNHAAEPGWYILKLDDPASAAALASRIDGLFKNSSSPTKTETEKAFQAGFVTMWGNIGFLVRAIGIAVFFAILLVAANTMMMAARERIGELAVLKALGYPNWLVSSFVLVESLVITLSGGVVGIVLARLALSRTGGPLAQFFPGFSVTTGTVMTGLGIATVLGVVSGIVPAWQAARLSVVTALRQVA